MGTKTPNYQLNQWEATDNFLRTDFNEDNRKIDSALKALDDEVKTKASQADLNSLTSTVATKANQTDLVNGLAKKCEAVVGSYTGEAASLGYGEGRTKDVTLGFRPKALFITTGGSFSGATSIVLFGTMSSESNGKVICKLTDSGFTVGTAMYGNDPIYPELNSKGHTYHYLAIG